MRWRMGFTMPLSAAQASSCRRENRSTCPLASRSDASRTRWWRCGKHGGGGSGCAHTGDQSLASTPAPTILCRLSRKRIFAAIAARSMIGSLKQVRRYLFEPVLRERARDRVRSVITPNAQVLVAHSLGSIVAGEASGHPAWALVTLGSPLGSSNLISDRLQPAAVNGAGVWPGEAGLMWTTYCRRRRW